MKSNLHGFAMVCIITYNFYYSIILGFMVPSSFTEGMIIDPPAISVPIKEEPG